MYVAACYPVGTTISKTSSLFTALLQHYELLYNIICMIFAVARSQQQQIGQLSGPSMENWSELRSQAGPDTPVIVLTATASIETQAIIKKTGVYLLDFFCSGIQFNLLLSPYPCFISLLYLDLYVLGDDALIS